MDTLEITASPPIIDTSSEKYKKLEQTEINFLEQIFSKIRSGEITSQNQGIIIRSLAGRTVKAQEQIDILKRDPLIGEYGFARKDEFNKLLVQTINEINDNPQPRDPNKGFQGAVLMAFDLDNFGEANNTHGHLWGDETLKHVAKIIGTHVRRSQDLLGRQDIKQNQTGRQGGDELEALLYDTDRRGAIQVAEAIREELMSNPIKTPDGKDWYQTASIGLTLVEPGVTVEEIINRADQAAYYAKNHGKNQTKIWEPALEKPTNGNLSAVLVTKA